MSKALVLRTCQDDMSSHGGFRWPTSGPVAAPDWDPKPECGNGLHGLLWGDGNWTLLNETDTSKWLVVEVEANEIVSLGDKVKFPRGTVIYCGDKAEAMTRVICARENFERIKAQSKGEISSGDGSTAASSGNGSTAASSGNGSTAASSGNYSKAASSGDGGIAMVAGYDGRAKAGPHGAFAIAWKDGDRPRVVVGHVGEGGVKPDTWYRVDTAGRLIELHTNGTDVGPVATKAAPKKRKTRRRK